MTSAGEEPSAKALSHGYRHHLGANCLTNGRKSMGVIRHKPRVAFTAGVRIRRGMPCLPRTRQHPSASEVRPGMANTHPLVWTGSRAASQPGGETRSGAAAHASGPSPATGGDDSPDARSLRSDSGPPAARLGVSERARSALIRMCRAHGLQVLLISWPAGATLLPAALFTPGPFDVIIGHVAGCPMHADLRQLGLYRDRHAVLDAPRWTLRARPVLRLLPSAAGPPTVAAHGGAAGDDRRVHSEQRR
jgi:hypothetical protein